MIKHLSSLLFIPLIITLESRINPIFSQPITPANDGTGTFVVSPDGTLFNISGGTKAGSNLFHSFEQFGLDQGQIANFISNPNIQNILGRVVGGDPSVINGLVQLTGGNSNLYIVNPAGILFGPHAQLQVPGSFTATTANGVQIGNFWFNALGSNNYAQLMGNPTGFAFTTDEPGSIVNAGNLSVSPGENITLVGGNVINTGTLSTAGGNITIAAIPGENYVRVTQEGNLLSLDLPVATKTAVNGDNTGISATSLPQLLTEGKVRKNTGIAVNNGQVTVNSLAVPDGVGNAIVGGTVDASNLVSGVGGTVQVLGDRVGIVGGEIDVSGVNGGGVALIGGDYKGQGVVKNALRTYVSEDSVIKADGLVAGDGGKVIVWADDVTGFYGEILARGGRVLGDGGFVEVSGKRQLTFRGNVDTSAINGNTGTLLLDPENVRIAPDGDITPEFLENNQSNVTVVADQNIEIAPGISLNFMEGLPDQDTSITFTADVNNDGVGDFIMDQSQSINTNGRGLTIEGANIITGDINTIDGNRGGNITLKATTNITTGDLTASDTNTNNPTSVNLMSTTGNIVVETIQTGANGATIEAGGLFRAVGIRDNGVQTNSDPVSVSGDILRGDEDTPTTPFLGGSIEDFIRSREVGVSGTNTTTVEIDRQGETDIPSSIVVRFDGEAARRPDYNRTQITIRYGDGSQKIVDQTFDLQFETGVNVQGGILVQGDSETPFFGGGTAERLIESEQPLLTEENTIENGRRFVEVSSTSFQCFDPLCRTTQPDTSREIQEQALFLNIQNITASTSLPENASGTVGPIIITVNPNQTFLGGTFGVVFTPDLVDQVNANNNQETVQQSTSTQQSEATQQLQSRRSICDSDDTDNADNSTCELDNQDQILDFSEVLPPGFQ